MPDGVVTKEEFIAYYDDSNINFPNNEVFWRFVSSMWEYTPDKMVAATEQEIKDVIKALRFKLIQQSQATKDDYLLRKQFATFDSN